VTLGKHCIQGVTLPKVEPRSSQYFESLMVNAGYTISGSAAAQGNRVKIWFIHAKYSRVEAIYSGDLKVTITAYHVQ